MQPGVAHQIGPVLFHRSCERRSLAVASMFASVTAGALASLAALECAEEAQDALEWHDSAAEQIQGTYRAASHEQSWSRPSRRRIRARVRAGSSLGRSGPSRSCEATRAAGHQHQGIGLRPRNEPRPWHLTQISLNTRTRGCMDTGRSAVASEFSHPVRRRAEITRPSGTLPSLHSVYPPKTERLGFTGTRGRVVRVQCLEQLDHRLLSWTRSVPGP